MFYLFSRVKEAPRQSARRSFSWSGTWWTWAWRCTSATRWGCCRLTLQTGWPLPIPSNASNGPTSEKLFVSCFVPAKPDLFFSEKIEPCPFSYSKKNSCWRFWFFPHLAFRNSYSRNKVFYSITAFVQLRADVPKPHLPGQNDVT